jgi:hypothetical protein
MLIEKKGSTIPLRDIFTYRNVDLMGVHAFETITVKAVNKMCNVKDDDIVIVKMTKNNELVMGKIQHQTSTDRYDFDTENYIVGIVDQAMLQKVENHEREIALLCSIDEQWNAIKASDRGKWTASCKAVSELEAFVKTIREYRTLLVKKEQGAETATRKTTWHRFCDERPKHSGVIFVYWQHGEASSGFFQYYTPKNDTGYGLIVSLENRNKPNILFTSDDIKREGSVLWWCEVPGK